MNKRILFGKLFPLSTYLDHESREGTEFNEENSRLILLAGIAEVLSQGQNVAIIGDELRGLVQEDIAAALRIASAHSKSDGYGTDSSSTNEDLNWNELLNSQRILVKELLYNFELTKSACINGETWPGILHQYQALIAENQTSLIDFQLRSNETRNKVQHLSEILETVGEAEKLYLSKFRLIESTNPFCESVFVQNDDQLSLSVLLKYLSNYIVKAQLVAERYVEFFNRLLNQLSLQSSNETSRLIFELKNIKSAPITQQEKLKKLSELSQSVKGSVYKECLPTAYAESKSNTNLSRLIEKSINHLEHIRRNQSIANSVYLKSVNSKNHPDEELIQIEKDFHALLESIDDSQIFKRKIESNAFSSLKMYNSLLDIITFLQVSFDQLEEMEEFYKWKTFANSIPKPQQQVISALAASNSRNWEEGVKAWYYKFCLQQITRFNSQTPSDSLDRYEKNVELIDADYIGIIKHLVKSRNFEDLNTAMADIGNHEFGTTVAKDIEDNSVRVLDFKSEIPKFPTANTIYFLSNSITNTRIEHPFYRLNLAQVSSEIGLIHHSQVKNSISVEDLGNKLNIARLLSKSILEAKSTISCYITSSSNIIIDCDEETTKLIVEHWQGESMKYIRLGGDADKGLIEFLLNDSLNAIYVYDYIDSSNHLSLYRQIQKNKALQNAGYRTVYFNPILMATNTDYSLEFQELLKVENH